MFIYSVSETLLVGNMEVPPLNYSSFYTFMVSLGIIIIVAVILIFINYGSVIVSAIGDIYFYFIIIIVFSLDIFLIYWGARNWYDKQQKPADRIARLQAKLLAKQVAEAETLKNTKTKGKIVYE